MKVWLAATVSALALVGSAAAAAETTTYRYDAMGRLVAVAVANGPTSGVTATYSYDSTGNRTRVAVGGVPTSSPSPTPSPTPAPTPTPTPASAAGPGDVRNGTFAQPSVGNGYRYNPSVPDNSFTAGAGVAGNGSGIDFPPTADGDGQVGFVQGASGSDGTPSAITLNTYGLTVGASYYVRFEVAQRRGYLGNQIAVAAGSQGLGSFTANSASWVQVATSSFTATSGMMPISFTGMTAADQTTGINTVEVLPAGGATPNATVASPSFEDPVVNSYAYQPAVSGVSFNYPSGIARNGGAFGFPATTDGNQAAFVQATDASGSFSQTVSGLTSGANYKVVFRLVARPGYVSPKVKVLVEGNLIEYVTAPAAWTQITTNAFTATASSTSILFQSVFQGSDSAAAIDVVQVLRQ